MKWDECLDNNPCSLEDCKKTGPSVLLLRRGVSLSSEVADLPHTANHRALHNHPYPLGRGLRTGVGPLRDGAGPGVGNLASIEPGPGVGPSARIKHGPGAVPLAKIEHGPVVGPLARVEPGPGAGPFSRVEPSPGVGLLARVESGSGVSPLPSNGPGPGVGPGTGVGSIAAVRPDLKKRPGSNGNPITMDFLKKSMLRSKCFRRVSGLSK